MEYNTIPFTNPDIEVFIGRYNSEDYPIQPGETRYFPSFISEHFAKQLIDKLFRNAMAKDKKTNRPNFETEIISEILGEEMMTLKAEPELSLKEKILAHEGKIKEMLAEKERKARAEKIEAMKLADESSVINTTEILS